MRNDLHDPDLPLGDLMARYPATMTVFLRHKMLCVGCLVSPFHTVIDACAEYDLDEAAFRAELQEAVSRAALSPAPPEHGASAH